MSQELLCLQMELVSLCELWPLKCPLKYLFCLQSTSRPPGKKKYPRPPQKREETLGSALNAPSLSASRSHSHLFPSLRCAAGRDESKRFIRGGSGEEGVCARQTMRRRCMRSKSAFSKWGIKGKQDTADGLSCFEQYWLRLCLFSQFNKWVKKWISI